jgi:ATP-dependent Clp protease ATP-binding subunit ClpA
MYPFERFSEDGKLCLRLAQEEAERSHHSYIGTEHLLLGIMRVSAGTAHVALKELGITIDPVRALIAAAVSRNERVPVASIIPTSRVKKVIEMAFEEARRMGHPEVDTGHILVALAIEGDGIAAHVLQDLGATAERVVGAVERALGVAESGRGEDRPRGQAFSPSPSPDTAGDVPHLMAVLHRPRTSRLLRAKGLDVDTLMEQLRNSPETIHALSDALNATAVELTAAVATQDFERAAQLRDRLNDLAKELEKAEDEWLDSLA